MVMNNQFEETLYDAYRQVFSIEEIYYESKSEHQHIIIFHNSKFGRVMALDGVIQTTERDEFIYHEMLTHVPVFSHGAVEKALIIGGGDGAMLREILRHESISRVTMVEIDQAVIDMCRQYLPNHSRGAFDDPRLNLVIADGAEYVAGSKDRFDIIIVDSTDPIGPGEVLFRYDFYENCRNLLSDDGIIVTQNGVAFFQPDEIRNTVQCFRRLFRDWSFFTASVPSYIGGKMAFGWGAENPNLRPIALQTLQERFRTAGLSMRYYTPEIHTAAFALPQYMVDIIDGTPRQ